MTLRKKNLFLKKNQLEQDNAIFGSVDNPFNQNVTFSLSIILL